ncbi:unnamed protein product, partial [Adineta steineri]
ADSQSTTIRTTKPMPTTPATMTSFNALTDYDDSPISNPNASYMSIDYNPYYEDITPLTIKMMKSNDATHPPAIRLRIYGCANPVPNSFHAQVENDTTRTVIQSSVTTHPDARPQGSATPQAGATTQSGTSVTATSALGNE